MTQALSIANVFKHYPGKPVLDGVDLQVPQGQIVGLLGRNGVGKTTLIDCALGLRETDRGDIRVFGQAPTAMDAGVKAKIGYVPQEADLFEWMSVEDMLCFFRAFYPRWNDDKVRNLLDRWSLRPAAIIGKLSGGEKQRLSIVRALAHDPELLVLDEPVASLDPAGRREFLRELIDATLVRGTTVLFSTHILTDLERVAVNVAFMRDGKIALQADLDEIAEDCVRIAGPAGVVDGIAASRVVSRTVAAQQVTLIARLDAATREWVAAHPALRVDALNLEDLFIEATR